MSEWVTRPLSALADIRVSNVDKKSLPGEKPVLLCNYMDAYANDYIRSDIAFMEATASAAEIAKFKVDAGDVVITKDSETPDDIGIPAVVVDQIDNLVCGYHLALLKTRQGLVDPVFLCKQLGSHEAARYFGQRAAGSTRYGLSNGALASFPVSLPTLPKQKKIAAVLKGIDTAIEKTEALIAKFQQIKAGLMHDLFTRGVLPNGQLRLPREQAPELYQETAIGWIPREWRMLSLGECGEIFNGTTPRREIPYYWGGDFPWLSSGKVNDYKITSADEFITQRALNETSLRLVPFGSVIVAMIGQGKTRGMTARLEINASINQNLAAIVPAEGYSSIYLHWYLQLHYERLRGDGRGSNQEALNCQLVRSFQVVMPEYEEQVRVSEIMRLFEAKEQIEVSNLDKLRRKKMGLMHDLLTGKVLAKAEEPEVVDG